MIVKLLTEQHLEFLGLKGSCRGSSVSTLVKIPHCWKSHVTAQLLFIFSGKMALAKTSKKNKYGDMRERYCNYSLCKQMKGKNVKALAYCPSCYQFLCGGCQIIHGTTEATKNHQVLIGKAMANFEDDETPKYEYCSTHSGFRKDLFCIEHKEMVCSKCSKDSHRRCVVKFIQEAAGSVTRVELSGFKEDIREFKRDLAFGIIMIDNNVKSVEKQRKELLKKNQETYDLLISNLSKLFGNIAAEIDKTCDDLNVKLDGQKSRLNEIIYSLESDVYAVELTKDRAMGTNVFIGLQQVVNHTRKCATDVAEIYSSFGMIDLSYKPSKQLRDIQSSAVHFVTIDIKVSDYKHIKSVPNITFPATSVQQETTSATAAPINELKFIERSPQTVDAIPDELDTTKSQNVSDAEKSVQLYNFVNHESEVPARLRQTDWIAIIPVAPLGTAFVPRPLNISTMKARLHQTFNVKADTDRYNCWIRGSAITADGKILMTDSNNHNVKLFSSDIRLLSSLSLSDAPWDIALSSNTEAVVSILKQNELQFISLKEDDLKLTHTLKLQFDVFGVTKCNDKLCVTCVSDPPSVKLIDKSGQVHWYASLDKKSKRLFRRPWYITSYVKDKATRVIVTDKEAETISQLDGDTGELLSFRTVKGKDPNGVTVDCSGNIYICYHGTDKICVLSEDLSKGRILLSMQDGLRACPYAIAYDPRMSRLVISNNSNKVDSYKLT